MNNWIEDRLSQYEQLIKRVQQEEIEREKKRMMAERENMRRKRKRRFVDFLLFMAALSILPFFVGAAFGIAAFIMPALCAKL